MRFTHIDAVCRVRRTVPAVLFLWFWSPPWALAQLNDVSQTPNPENAGIKKSLTEQVGAGRGSIYTPGSSLFLVARDPFRSIARGRQLFQRKFTMAQGFGPRTSDGVGDIMSDGSHGAGLVDSCAGCHGRPRGSAGFGGNVFTRPDSRDAPHLFGLGLVEMLADEITRDLRRTRDYALRRARAYRRRRTVTLESKGIRYGRLTAYPDGTVDTSGVEGVDDDLRIRPFFAQGGTISIREFIVGALNAEMGLEAPDPDLREAANGGRVVTPAGMVLDGRVDRIEAPPVSSPSEDGDGDGVVNEIDTALVDHMEFYLLNYFKPGTYKQSRDALYGRIYFNRMDCDDCHKPELEIEHDRRVADVETAYDPVNGVFNRLFAVATPLFDESNDHSGYPTLKTPRRRSFVVRNFYSDLKRHDLGPALWERNFDGTMQKEFVTEPLWGVGSTPPYGHDGRSINLYEIIARHGGEAESSRRQFNRAGRDEQEKVIAFLQTLVLFSPPDTASNLNPGDPNHPDFPQRGHGGISLPPLFVDSSDPE